MQNMDYERLSIDVSAAEHRRIKAFAALYGMTMRDYVLDSIRERLRRAAPAKKRRGKHLSALDKDPVLKELWDNTQDAAYDAL